MAHGPLSMCPGAGQRRIPTSRARMERVEQDQSRADSAGMGTRDDRDQADSAKSKATEAEMQASSRAILTSRAQPEYRPCGVSVFTARLITDPVGKREDGLGRVARGADNPKPRIPTPRGKNTDTVGKMRYRDRDRHAPGETVRALPWRSSKGFQGELGLDRQDPTVTDPMGNDYRAYRERIPTLLGGFLPIRWGKNADPPGRLYRPQQGRLPTLPGNFTNEIPAKRFFRVGFVGLHDVNGMALMFCLVSREVMGGCSKNSGK